MKFVIRAFFKTLRLVLGPVMLLRERLTRPTGLVRAPAAQALVDQQCQSLALYQYATCPFCAKVRQEMRRLSLPIEKRAGVQLFAGFFALYSGVVFLAATGLILSPVLHRFFHKMHLEMEG